MNSTKVALLVILFAVLILVAWNGWVFAASQEFLPVKWNIIILGIHAIAYFFYYLWDQHFPKKIKAILPRIGASLFVAVLSGTVITAIISVIIDHNDNRTFYSILVLTSIPLAWYFYRKLESDELTGNNIESEQSISFEGAFGIVGEYGELIEKFYNANMANGTLRMKIPESKLPYPKVTIKKACALLYLTLKDGEVRKKLKELNNEISKQLLAEGFSEHLKTGYCLLAECLPDHEADLCNKFYERVKNPQIKMSNREVEKVKKIFARTEEERNRLLADFED